jgi:O-antigen/teichoic acid export membrane protein
VLHFLPSQISEGRLDRAHGTILSSLLLPALVAISLVGLLWQSAAWLASTVLGAPDALWYLRLFALSIPVLCLSEILGTITRGFGHAKYYVFVRHLVPPITYVILLGVLATTQAAPLWIAGAFGASYAAAFLAGLASLAVVSGSAIWRVKPVFEIRALYAYSTPIVLNTLLFVAIGFTDILMLGSLSGASQSGIYRGCLQLIAVFPVIIIALSASVAHVFPVLAKQNRVADLDHTYATVARFMTLLSVAAAVLIGVNRIDLLSLLGARFDTGATALLVLLLCQVVRGCVGAGAFLLLVSGYQRLETLNALIGVIANVLLNFLFIPRYGLVGAAAATLAAHSLMNTMRLFQIRRRLGFSALRAPLLNAVCVGLGIVAVAEPATHLLGVPDGSGILSMALRVPPIALLLGLGLWRFALVNEDRDRFRRILSGRQPAEKQPP